jgi:hypothetical protein
MVSWFVAAATAIEAAAVVIAVLYAKGQLAELRESREETTRPFVVVDFDAWQTLIYLKVNNVGQSIARNVTFEFSTPLESTWDGKKGGGEYRLAELEMFAAGIPSLPPGKEHSTIFDQFPDRLPAGLPKRYEVEVDYEGPKGRRYTDRQVLSLDHYIGLVRVDRKGLHELSTTLDKIRREIERWGASGGGLRVANDQDIRKRFDRFMEAREQPARDEPTDESPPEEDDAAGDSDEEAA